MKKLKLFGSSLLIVTMLFHSVPAKADPPPGGVWYFNDPSSRDHYYLWNPNLNRFERHLKLTPTPRPNEVD